MSNRQSRRNGSGGNLSWLKQQWFQLTATSLITTVVSVGAAFLFDRFGPVNPQVEKQIEQLEKSIQKDEWFITLAQELTGKVDTQTVERVKKEVVATSAGRWAIIRQGMSLQGRNIVTSTRKKVSCGSRAWKMAECF